MRWTMYYPVGLNDVAVLGEGRPAEGRNYREWTRYALEELEGGGLDVDDPDDLDFPLARVICDRLSDESIDVSGVVLFASDQEDEEYRRQDTLHAAEILKRYLEFRLGGEAAVRVERLRGNPSDYGGMVDWMRGYAAELETAGPDTGSLLIIGPGTPATTTALALVFSHFDGRARAWYISKSAGAQDIDLLAHLERERWRRALRELVEAGDFRGARNVLREANIQDKSLAPVFEALWHLVTFSPENAERALEKFEGEGFDDLVSFIRQVRGGAPGARMALLVANIKARYESGYRVEALALTARFSEEIMKLTVFNELGMRTTGRKRGTEHKDFLRAAKGDKAFWSDFEYLVQERNLKPRQPSTSVYKAALDALAKVRPNARIDLAVEVVETFRESRTADAPSLARLRNKTAYGHGFSGIAEADLRNVLGDRSLPQAVDHYYSRRIGHAPEDVFEAARRELLERISSLK